MCVYISRIYSNSCMLALIARIDAVSRDLHLGMSSNRLSLNPNKTQFIWFGTPQQLLKLDIPLLTERFSSFAFHSSVRNLYVVQNSTITFSEHVANLTRTSYFHLRRLRAIRPFRRSVSSHVFTSIVHAFACSRIDYCNSLLVGLTNVCLSGIDRLSRGSRSDEQRSLFGLKTRRLWAVAQPLNNIRPFPLWVPLFGIVSHLKSALFHGICPARFTSSLKLLFLPGPGLGAPLSSYLEVALYKFHR